MNELNMKLFQEHNITPFTRENLKDERMICEFSFCHVYKLLINSL